MSNKKKNDIVKSNALIEASYNPRSVYGMRLLMASLMQVKSKSEVDPAKRYYVSAGELAEMVGGKNKSKNNYNDLKKAADDLMEVKAIIDHDPDGNKLEERLETRLVSSCKYNDGQGTVGLRFTSEVIPYISSLRKRFTQYQAEYVMPMSSMYGVRLYEICLQHLNKCGPELVLSVDEFRYALNIQNKYEKLAEVKRNVVTPALRDISKHSDLNVEFEYIKRGRTVTGVCFEIKRKPAAKVPGVKILTIREFVGKYNIGYGETDYSDATKKKYAEYKANPNGWKQAGLSY